MCLEDRQIAFISGDQVLPRNMLTVMSVLDNFVAEHFCLSMMLADRIEVVSKYVDVLLYLDIPKEICLERIQTRAWHTVNLGLPIDQLAVEINTSVNKLSSFGVPVKIIGKEALQYIYDYEIVGDELRKYLGL